MTFENQMGRMVGRLAILPKGLRARAQTRLLGTLVPFVGTAGLVFEEITPERVVVSIKNSRRAQNHIKGVHAAAMVLLAETASGFAVGMNLPDDKLPLIKTLKVDYLKRSRGAMRAVATLRPEQVESLRNETKGEVSVPVVITDESGEAPIACEMIWAFIPKQRSDPP